MTEEEARDWIAARTTSAAMERVERFLVMVSEENDRQNLIAPSTIATIWNRHALDSYQLIQWGGNDARTWLDIGTGGGFPGMIVAAVWDGKVTMVEPRRKRAEFLEHCADLLGLSASIVHGRVEQIGETFDIISARAVASIDELGRIAGHCARRTSRWLLPRGTIDDVALERLDRLGTVFHVEQSLSDPGSSILIVDGSLT